ncbi:hypothetical protein GCM10007161_06430 [Ignatzschineria indica]|uniref:Uncharacterized protein n=1 Tax=Ignatzschineria indica TaxID=472583 RepID=A0A2U2AN69_9GAMM|nr:hypothetical protein [Ignatzschineria indica]PWD84615.1 hypothetical protein DC082_03530 [Ignatzschineria indica]GGZ77839.1 hypothetical protein GCM10007161_06430 [Ignatzschineria indica]
MNIDGNIIIYLEGAQASEISIASEIELIANKHGYCVIRNLGLKDLSLDRKKKSYLIFLPN